MMDYDMLQLVSSLYKEKTIDYQRAWDKVGARFTDDFISHAPGIEVAIHRDSFLPACGWCKVNATNDWAVSWANVTNLPRHTVAFKFLDKDNAMLFKLTYGI